MVWPAYDRLRLEAACQPRRIERSVALADAGAAGLHFHLVAFAFEGCAAGQAGAGRGVAHAPGHGRVALATAADQGPAE